ncbi:MAG: CDP-alcohol phosphatidyltransferase family protein [Thermoplasmata archaeon]
MLDSYRSKVDRFLTPLSMAFAKLNPNLISLISLVLAAVAGLSFYYGLLVISFFALFFSALFDAVDGKVARIRNLSSKRGDMIDHTFDRYSDIFIILGFSFSAYGNVYLGLFAIIGILMTSYMGTQSQALGLNRLYAGVMGRADRLVLSMLFIIIQIFIRTFYYSSVLNITPTNLILIIFGIFGNATALQRFVISYKKL